MVAKTKVAPITTLFNDWWFSLFSDAEVSLLLHGFDNNEQEPLIHHQMMKFL